MPSRSSTKQYDAIAPGFYDNVFQRRQGIQSKWHHQKFARVLTELAGYKDILDLGCGPGTMIGQLASDVNAIGVDIASKQIDFATNRYGATNRHFLTIIENVPLPFPEKSFDAVSLVEFIEHLRPIESLRLLREVHRVIRPGGKLIITTPNYHSFWPVLEFVINLVGKVTYEKQHICHYNLCKLRKLIASAGFTQFRVTPFLFAAPFFAPFGWELADRVACWEAKHCAKIAGNLLLGIGGKN